MRRQVPGLADVARDSRSELPDGVFLVRVDGAQFRWQVIEQAIETAARMLGTDKSRGYCLEMICADFLAGAHLDNGNPEILLSSISRYYRFLPAAQREVFLSEVSGRAS